MSRLIFFYTRKQDTAPEPVEPPKQTEPVPDLQGTEFLQAASGCPICDVLGILDKHMSAIQIVQPKEYEAIMRRIRALKDK